MGRTSLKVWHALNENLAETVTNYHPSVTRLPTHTKDLIGGTAFFPGGSGLWRGDDPHGALPELFPEQSLMFVGHNFDSIRAFERTRARGGEASGSFWKTLRAILTAAAIEPEHCFFTNALMGLQPGSSTGPMPSTREYLDQCTVFLAKQIRVVQPCAVISLGKPAYTRLLLVAESAPCLALAHPSALTYIAGPKRPEWIAKQSVLLSEFISSLE